MVLLRYLQCSPVLECPAEEDARHASSEVFAAARCSISTFTCFDLALSSDTNIDSMSLSSFV